MCLSCRQTLTYQSCSGTAVYRGVSLKKVLKIASGGIQPEAKHIEFIAADTYFKYVSHLKTMPPTLLSKTNLIVNI